MQEHLSLHADQEIKILESYTSMHGMLVRCAEERNNIIFPDIQKALNLFPKVTRDLLLQGLWNVPAGHGGIIMQNSL